MRISIPEPCHENWSKMTPNEQGAFCNACAKTVVDFSKMSDHEVLHYFQHRTEERTCGRFRKSQLAPYELQVDLHKVARLSFPKFFAASVFIFFTSLFVCKGDAGDTVQVKVSYAWQDAITDTTAVFQADTFALDTVTSVNGQVDLCLEGDSTVAFTDSLTQASADSIGGIDTILIGDTSVCEIELSTSGYVVLGNFTIETEPDSVPTFFESYAAPARKYIAVKPFTLPRSFADYPLHFVPDAVMPKKVKLKGPRR